MESTYGEFQGTELDPNLDFDFDDEGNDLLPVLGVAAGVAALVGGALVILGRRRNPSAADNAQEMLEKASKQGKKGLEAITKSVEDAKLGDLLEEALTKARHTADDADLDKVLKEAQKLARDARKRAKKVASNVDVGETVGDVRKRVEEIELAALLQDALSKAKDASSRVDLSGVGDTAGGVRKRLEKAFSNGHAPEIDTEKAGKFLDVLRERLVEAVESVREDVAPKAQEAVQTVAHRVQEDMIPAAQETVEKLRDDVIPEAQERATKLAEEEIAPRARQAAKTVKSRANSLSEMLQVAALAALEKMVDDILPQARKAGERAVKTAQEDVIPAAASTAEDAVQRVREDVLPRMGKAAEKTPEMLSDVLAMALERAAEARDKVKPMAEDAATFGKHRASDVAESMRGGKSGVTGAVSSAGSAVSGAAKGAASATAHTTREFVGILFWLAVLGGLVLMVFVPDRKKQEELWNNTRQFFGEVREMWRDLQGPDYDTEGEDDNLV
jgi:hypothetical protein